MSDLLLLLSCPADRWTCVRFSEGIIELLQALETFAFSHAGPAAFTSRQVLGLRKTHASSVFTTAQSQPQIPQSQAPHAGCFLSPPTTNKSVCTSVILQLQHSPLRSHPHNHGRGFEHRDDHQERWRLSKLHSATNHPTSASPATRHLLTLLMDLYNSMTSIPTYSTYSRSSCSGRATNPHSTATPLGS